MRRTKWLYLAVAFAVLVGVAPANAQLTTGGVYITAVDSEGSPLPGVTITISGQGADKVGITDAQGKTRVVALDPGQVVMTASLDGFSTVEYPEVNIRANYNVTMEVTLTAAVEEVITVTSESPLLDERKIQTGATVTQIELEKIPTARDPWALLQQTPGVLVDRINVGGAESGQQATFRAPGTTSFENDFLVDGVQITDMVASGGSSTYFGFDQFTEMQFGTGGADVTKATAGVSVNLITKRGTNEFRGSANFGVTDSDGLLWFDQSTSEVDSGDLPANQTNFTPNKINKIEEWGFEAGGPLFRDRVWFWGSHSQNDIKNITTIGASDDTILTNTAFKVNAQFTGSNSGLGSWNNGDKEKFGRNVSVSRPPDVAWDQRGPSAIIKFEDTHVFSSNFFLTGGYNKVDGGFQLVSPAVIREGLGVDGAPQAHRNADRVWEGSYLGGGASRPQEEMKVDGSYFFNTGAMNHELKFGARLREAERATSWKWSNEGAWSLDIGGGKNPAGLFTQRGDVPDVSQDYTSAWLQDTITKGNWTVNVGLRYDLQEATNEPFTSGDNFWFPDLHPSVTFNGGDPGFDWSDITPRIGVTYALGEDRKTLLRGSFSQFPEQLDASGAARVNPAGTSYMVWFWYDDDGDGEFSGAGNITGNPGHTDSANLWFTSGFDPANPTELSNPNRNDPGYSAEMTTELVLGVEHAFLPEFVVGATVTMRNTDDIAETRTLIDDNGVIRTATRNDYFLDGGVVSGVRPDGSAYSYPTYGLNGSRIGGSLLLNGDRSVEYLGYGFTATKRLSNDWMLRAYLQFGEAEWDVGPDYVANSSPNRAEFLTDVDGALFGEDVGTRSGAFGNVFTQSTWQYNVSGMYQVAPDRPWGFNVAANIFGREGYPLPYYEGVTPTNLGGEINFSVVDEVDQFRADDVFNVDLRLDKEFAASGDVSFTFGIDLFNAFNEAYVMQRQRALGGGTADFVTQTLSARVWRLSARLNWR